MRSNIAVYTIAEVFLLLQMLDYLVIIISTPHEKQQQTIIITGQKKPDPQASLMKLF
jgi:hypothetical protein